MSSGRVAAPVSLTNGGKSKVASIMSSSVRDRVTPEEWEQRVALAAVYRLVAHFHWDDLIFTL
jgi:hypothetical protein